LSDAKHNFDGLWRLIIWFFFAPRWSEYCFFSFSGSTGLPPGGQILSRRVEVISIRDFANSVNVLESNLIFQRSCLFKSNCWNEIREMLVLEVFLKIKFLQSKIQHTLFNVVFWLPCILKTEMTCCKIKMTFSWFFCVSFNLWSWVYLSMVYDEVTFCELQETKGSSQNLRIHQERLFSF
jgi:hypothetical protein